MIVRTAQGKRPAITLHAKSRLPGASRRKRPIMFVQHQNRTMWQAAGSTLLLIYHQTVYNLRKMDRSPVIGLFMVLVKALVMVGFFVLMYYVVGIKSSPIRGDFILFILSGIFMYLCHVAAVGAVSGSGGINSQLTKHGPLNSAVLICGSALAVLYQQVLSVLIILGMYHALLEPITIYHWVGCLGLLVLGWFWGCCVGLVFLGITPWWPKAAGIGTVVYQRVNMIASGKMFVGNAMPAMLLPYFEWNPLFHIIDQMRGEAFINYNPRNSSLDYVLDCVVAFLMIGLMIVFVTRNKVSISWRAGK